MVSVWLSRQSRNSPGFDPSVLWLSEIWGAADEEVLNNLHKKKKFKYILQQEKVEILETATFANQEMEQRLVEQRLKYPFFI